MQCRYGQTFLYHRNYGHTTEGFQVLKDKIEEIVQADGLVSLAYQFKKLIISRAASQVVDAPPLQGRNI